MSINVNGWQSSHLLLRGIKIWMFVCQGWYLWATQAFRCSIKKKSILNDLHCWNWCKYSLNVMNFQCVPAAVVGCVICFIAALSPASASFLKQNKPSVNPWAFLLRALKNIAKSKKRKCFQQGLQHSLWFDNLYSGLLICCCSLKCRDRSVSTGWAAVAVPCDNAISRNNLNAERENAEQDD